LFQIVNFLGNVCAYFVVNVHFGEFQIEKIDKKRNKTKEKREVFYCWAQTSKKWI